MKHITLIAGARPNFMKVAPIIDAIKEEQGKGNQLTFRLVHTGQHYDRNMSHTFFEELGIPEPDVNLGSGGGTQAEQTAAIMVTFEKDLKLNPTDLVVVVGDVNSTMACTIVAKKMHTRVAHVEAGIRSGDMTMPEEINRIVTDALCDYHFTTTAWALQNLRNSGIKEEQIFLVGNVMVDTLLKNKSRFRKPELWEQFNIQSGKYFVLTLHRPSNVDDQGKLLQLLEKTAEGAGDFPVIFPAHPRTSYVIKSLTSAGSWQLPVNIMLCEPMSYLEFNFMVSHCTGVITDSGGITEETTILGIPCVTLRDTTERPETVEIGTNLLAGTNPAVILPLMNQMKSGQWKKGQIPYLWDGNSARRIVEIIKNL